MKPSFRTTLAAAAFAITSAANFASLPSAALTVAAHAAPWLGAGAGFFVAGGAMASTVKAIPGIGIRVKKSPGGSVARFAPIKSAKDGSFHLSGLEAGDYEVTADGGKSAIFKVGSDGRLSGLVQSDRVVQTPPSTQRLRPCPNFETDPCMLVQSPASVGKGIKDPAVKGCNGCGMTGKEAAPEAGSKDGAVPSAESGTIVRNGGVKGTCATGRDRAGNCLDK